MQQEPAPAPFSGSQQDSARPHTPTVPPPESSESHQPRMEHSPPKQAREEEFQFLCCQQCQAEAKNPKLLLCLHTLCSGCLEAQGTQCPICKVPPPPGASAPALDNVFFESLQRRLAVHRQIVSAQAACTRCQKTADFWCFECEQLLCGQCFEAHRWFLKHEARPLTELRSQSVGEFLEGTRKSNNIFCSNSNHRTPELTSIYCRGCAKPQCCACALLDSSHTNLKCDIIMEIQQRQEELDSMTQALQTQDTAFGSAQAKMHSAISQLERVRSDTEEAIRTRVHQLITHLQAQERELLQAVKTRYQREHEKITVDLGRLEAVLQRIRTGIVLVQRLKRYASDQEMLDMHGFLSQALQVLRQEEPQSLKVTVCTDSFKEFKVGLQDLVSCITQETDTAVPSAETASPRREASDINLPEGPSMAQAQALKVADSQPVGVVQPVPGAHPVPTFAYSIKDLSCGQAVCTSPPLKKRKSCQTECPKKLIKMESEEEKEARLAQSSSKQPMPSTSKAVSPQHPEETPSPKSHTTRNEELPLNSNHETDETGNSGEAENRVVVISSSEDSDVENSPFWELEDSSSESSDLQLEGPSSLRVLNDSIPDLQSEDRPLVFFDLKIDGEIQKIRQLAAVNQESKFRVLIQREAFSVYSRAVSLEVGLEHFLHFLRSMNRPVLACYKLWGRSLPTFFRALEDMNRLWEFQETISGFLATLPLIQECVPQASSFKLKNLAKTYLARNMSEHSALASVLAMRDLCRLLEVSPGPQLAPHTYLFSNLQCFGSLQPLVQAAALSRAEARLLALHNVNFTELLTTYRQDPLWGLKKYNRYLQATLSPLAQPALNLQALTTYFKSLLEEPALAQAESISNPLARHSLAEGASQQS